MPEVALRPYQRTIAMQVALNRRSCVWAGMGMGKTLSTLAAVAYLKRTGEVGPSAPVLVLAPLRVARTTWPDEARKWPSLGVSCVAAVGTPAERVAALQAGADVVATNYEQLPWLVERFGSRWPFAMVVCDESTRLKSFRLGGGGGSRAKALSRVAFVSRRFVELTGTPSPNGLVDLWGQLWFIDRGQRLGRSFRAFASRWFREVRCGPSPFAKRLEPYPESAAEIQAALRDVVVSVRAEDWFPTDAPVRTRVEVDLPPSARKVYRQLEAEFFASLDDGSEVDVANAAVRSAKCLQVASGVVYCDGGDAAWSELHDAKLDALRSVAEEAAGEPLLVAYHWKADAERIRRAFPEAVLLDKSPETVRRWNAGRIPVLLVHPASAGHGLNLQDGGRRLVNFSPWWNLEEAQQVVERIGPTRQAQSGHPRTVFIHDLVARDTLDEAVLDRLEGKASVQEALVRAMSRRKEAV